MLTEGSKGGPFSTNQAQNRNFVLGRSSNNSVVAGNNTRADIATGSKGSNTGELKDNLFLVDANLWEDIRHQFKEVVNFFIGANCWNIHIVRDVGSSNQNLAENWIHQNNSAITIFKEDLTVIASFK